MLAVVLMLALPAAAKNQWTVRGTAYDVDTIVYPHQVGPGVTYSRYDLPAYPLKVSVMEIDLNNPYIDLEAYLAKGTVLGVDDTGSLLMHWDNGSGLNVVYGEDLVRKL